MDMLSLTPVVRAWVEQDPDAHTRDAAGRLLEAASAGDAAAAHDLQDAFLAPVRCQAGGLQAPVGAGPGRMNRAVVIRAAAALMELCTEAIGAARAEDVARGEDAAPLASAGAAAHAASGSASTAAADVRVVIGYDARQDSPIFARDVAAVVTAAGGQALLFDDVCPSPMLAYAVRALHADAGVMVTSSQTPMSHNGLRIYLGGRVVTDTAQGAPLGEPWDERLCTAMTAVGPATEVPRAETGWHLVGDELREPYIERAAQAGRMKAAQDLSIVYTPLHGSGGHTCVAALTAAGFRRVHVVESQYSPDAQAPTVERPDVDAPGALDRALDEARRRDADLLIAHDGDAGRCAVALPDPHAGGRWRVLSGDELGALLGEQAAELAAFTGTGVLASSGVSSRLLRMIAQSHGLGYRRTLSGTQWVARTPALVFGYEQDRSYCVDPATVRDRDGISTAVRMAVLTSVLARQGRHVSDLYDRIAREHGLYASDTLYMTATDPQLIDEVMERLRAGGAPSQLAGSPITDMHDLYDGISDGNGGHLPPTNGLLWLTAANDRIIIVPAPDSTSLRCFLDVVTPVGDSPIDVARQESQQRLEVVGRDLRALIGLG